MSLDVVAKAMCLIKCLDHSVITMRSSIK